MWEILTYGTLPYANSDGKQIVLMLKSGERLDKPATCSSNLFNLLQECKFSKI